MKIECSLMLVCVALVGALFVVRERAFAQANFQPRITATNSMAGGVSCDLYASNTTVGAISALTTIDQSVKHSGTHSVCKIIAYMDANVTGTAHAVVNGVSSDSQTWTGAGWVTFTFSSPVSRTGDFTFSLVQESGQPYFSYRSDDPYQNGQGYDCCALSGYDLVFQVFLQ